ncbi:MAG TPA: tripartite tricarboxylate transporter substrate binding protein [Burkholderiales bacterium]|jgi:tripartite-type tricarboxylate transporter receptor subunit TctC
MKRLNQVMRAAVCAAFLFGGAAQAESVKDFPSHPVRLIVAFPAGGGTDIVARLIAPELTKVWGQQVVIDNRAGAAGVIGTELAATAAPDGYTLFIGTLGNLSVNQHIYKMNIDPQKAFAPITQVVDVFFVMVSYPGLPVKNVPELITLAKAEPGKLTFSSSGAGGAPHLAGELFNRMAGVKLVHVPYKGSAPSFQDLMAGLVSVTSDSLVQALPFIRDNRLRPLGVLGKKRVPQLPDVPTVGETVPGYELTNWFGMVMPAAVPKDLQAKISADVIKALASPELRANIASKSAAVIGDSPKHFGETMAADSVKWGKIVKETGMKAE